jgi:hypothetical protein
LIVHGGGQALPAGQLLSFHFLFFFLKDFPVELLLELEQVPEHARQFVRQVSRKQLIDSVRSE